MTQHIRTFGCLKPVGAVVVAVLLTGISLTPRVGQGDDGDGAEESPDAPAAAKPALDELFLFVPARHPNGDWEPPHLNFEDVWFEAEDGTRLHGWYCRADEPRAVAVYAHGNAGNITHRAAYLAYLQSQMHLSVLAFDYRGYGKSEGIPSVPGALEDAAAAHKKVAELAGVDPTEVVFMGRSLGGAIMIEQAATSPPRALVVESTFSSLRDAAEVHYPKLVELVDPHKLNCVERIGQYHGPLLYSHGTADRVIPYGLGKNLFDAANEPKRLVRILGGRHNDSHSREYLRVLDRFLDQLPMPSRAAEE